MHETELASLARLWWDTLAAECPMSVAPRETRRLLADLVGELAACLGADSFDASAGAVVGAALVSARLTDPAVPAVSAQVLCQLAEHERHPDTRRKLAALLVAFGQGYGDELCKVQYFGRHTERSKAEARQEADDRFRVVFDNAAVAIAIGDTDGKLLDVNRGLADMIGVSIEDLRGVSVYDFAHPDDRDAIRTIVYQQLVPNGKGTVKLEQRLLRADGSYGWASFAITYVKGVGSRADYLLAVGEDVTEQHQLRDELHRQARHDMLTGLPNRRYLLERVEAMIACADVRDRVGVCFIDIDGFKDVNDRYGHGMGDQVLTEVGTRLRDSVDECGCLVARIGGDEFVAVIPPPADDTCVAATVTSLQSALTEPITVAGLCLRTSVSIGAILTPLAGTQAESLLDAADTALYRAKAEGKPSHVVGAHIVIDRSR